MEITLKLRAVENLERLVANTKFNPQEFQWVVEMIQFLLDTKGPLVAALAVASKPPGLEAQKDREPKKARKAN